jgi:hypothetical protein
MTKHVDSPDWKDGAVDPASGYAHEDENMAAVKGTYPNPRPGASGKTAIASNHPTFGG